MWSVTLAVDGGRVEVEVGGVQRQADPQSLLLSPPSLLVSSTFTEESVRNKAEALEEMAQ